MLLLHIILKYVCVRICLLKIKKYYLSGYECSNIGLTFYESHGVKRSVLQIEIQQNWGITKKKTKSHARVMFATGTIALNLGLWSDIAHIIIRIGADLPGAVGADASINGR